MWNAGKVTDTECEGRQRDAYNQRHLATRLTPIPMRLRHCNDSATSKYRNNSNNTAKCECSAMYSYYDGLSASLCVLIDGLSALRDLIMMVSAFAMQASTTYSEASASRFPIWHRVLCVSRKVSELASVLRSWYGRCAFQIQQVVRSARAWYA